MTKEFSKALKSARKNAGFTQESAAEMLHVAVRTYAKYESGETVPAHDIVDAMMQLFRNNALGYTYLHEESAVYRRLYTYVQKPIGLASGVINFHVQLTEAVKDYGGFETICADEVITSREAPACSRYLKNVDNLVAAAIGVKMAVNGQKRAARHWPDSSKGND